MLSLNMRARELLDPLFAAPEAYRVKMTRHESGATIVDCGIEVPGSYAAGVLFSRVCMAGLGEVTLAGMEIGELSLPAVTVTASRPVEALMASQYAGWAISRGKYFAMGSGPARALNAGEELFKEIAHKEHSDTAVLCLETGKLPPGEVIDYIAGKTGVAAGKLFLLAAPTASVVGSVQVSARVVETAVHKLHTLGFPLDCVIHGHGVAPVAPVAGNDLAAIGRTNDCVLYGGRVALAVDMDDALIEEKVGQIPSSASKDYGTTFAELFARYGDFYKIDPLLFSPAQVTVNNLRSGRVWRAGAPNEAVLRASLGLA